MTNIGDFRRKPENKDEPTASSLCTTFPCAVFWHPGSQLTMRLEASISVIFFSLSSTFLLEGVRVVKTHESS